MRSVLDIGDLAVAEIDELIDTAGESTPPSALIAMVPSSLRMM